MPAAKQPKKNSAPSKTVATRFQKYKRWMWAVFALGVLAVVGLFTLVSFTKMPSRESLENPKYELSSIIYTDDMHELGSYYTKNRAWVPFEDINPHVVDALVATEDERYFSHTGIDFKSFFRAVAYLGKRGGASTITQQLAKQFYTPKPGNTLRRVWQKMKEWVIAIEFEKRYTKQEILAMLLNKYEFIYGANGIGAAAKTYFGKDQSALTLHESAVLIGMFKNPYYYNPVKHPENAKRRTQTVLKQMVKNKYISQAQYDELKDQPIDMSNFNRPMHYKGNAPYFRAELKKYIDDILDDEGHRKADGTKYNIYQDGLKIYTTINMTMQRYAEQAVAEHMQDLQNTYWKRWNGKDPWSYGLDAKEKDQAKSQLRRLIKATDRYAKMRSRALSQPIAAIQNEVDGTRFLDSDILRMINEGKKAGHFKKLQRQKTISKKQVAVYKQVMKSEGWADLVAAYAKLQKDVRKVFNTKVRMKVFDHAKGEKTVSMTPLDSIKYHHQHMQVGSLAIDPHTGYVRTWVGGLNYKYFKYDHVMSSRQVGSTFKPFLYATALSNGISPCTKYQDIQHVIPKGSSGFNVAETWAPGNARSFSGQWMNLYEGLKTSTNSISVALLKDIGNVNPIRELASNCGLPEDDIPPYPSIALGVPELRVIDMAAAYTTFANNGTHVKPVLIKRIEDKNGKVIYQGISEEKKAINPKYNHAMLDLLRNAAVFLKDHRGIESDVAGKTGTTNDHVDGWFMGITPDLVVGTWVGGESKYIHFSSLSDGQGSKMARPIFTKFLRKLEKDDKVYDKAARYILPKGDLLELDCSKYKAYVAPDTSKVQVIEVEDDEFAEEEDL